MELEKHVLFRTVIGSHMWRMQHPGSDLDYFVGFAYPTEIFLRGYHPKESFFYASPERDEHYHEIEKIIAQLLKGNLNFVLGVMSPVVEDTSPVHQRLRELLEANPPRNIYHSVRGFAEHNLKIMGDNISEHKLNKILRVLNFGIGVLRDGKYLFEPATGATVELVREKLKELEKAYAESENAETVPEEELRDLLFEVRMQYLRKKE